jgi:hypothetical protein
MKEQVGEKRNTVGTKTLIKTRSPTVCNKYVVNKKNSSILMISVSENPLLESLRFLLLFIIFFTPRLTTWFVTRVTRECHYMSSSHHRFRGFVLLNLFLSFFISVVIVLSVLHFDDISFGEPFVRIIAFFVVVYYFFYPFLRHI